MLKNWDFIEKNIYMEHLYLKFIVSSMVHTETKLRIKWGMWQMVVTISSFLKNPFLSIVRSYVFSTIYWLWHYFRRVLKFALSNFIFVFSQCQSNLYFFSSVHMMSMSLGELYSCQERWLILLKTLSGNIYSFVLTTWNETGAQCVIHLHSIHCSDNSCMVSRVESIP